MPTTYQQPSAPVSNSIRDAELAEKQNRIFALLELHKLKGLLIERHDNIAWATAGAVDARIAQGSLTAPVALLYLRDGRKYYIAPNNEAPRLAAEEFPGLGFTASVYPWQQNHTSECAHQLAGAEALAADTRREGFQELDLAPLRTPLTAGECARFRLLGQQTAACVSSILTRLEPGILEEEMAAETAACLVSRGITPTVLLMAADERIFRYRHALPRGGRLTRYGMLNLCARKWGLVVSITRFVHFGVPSAELGAAFGSAAAIHAALLDASHPGALSGDIYSAACRAYADQGAVEEIELHHQGGTAGYAEREWLITPGGTQRVSTSEVFAYNPSLRGAKVEDTVLINNAEIEVLTATPGLPVLEVERNGRIFRAAGVLVRK